MASCDLTIELDGSRTSYHPGEEVSGHVCVQTSASVPCNALTIELNWETHGRGNRTKGDGEQIELFAGEFPEGTAMRYRFRFTLPAGPATYDGHYLNVGWFLRARADLPWKLDPKAEQEVRLCSGPRSHQQLDWQLQYGGTRGAQKVLRKLAGTPRATASPRENAIGIGCILLVLSPLFAAGAYYSWIGLSAMPHLFEGDWKRGFPAVVFSAVTLLVGGWLGLGSLRSRLVGRRFGDVDTSIEPRLSGKSEDLAIHLTFTPTRDTPIHRVVARLTGTEIVVSGAGTRKSTIRHKIAEEEFELMSSTQVLANRPVRVEGHIRIPDDAPPSFRASHNRLEWKVDTRIEVLRFPDWHREHDIVVQP